MTDALGDHEGTAVNGGRAITNLRFADDIDGLEREKEELAKLFEHSDKVSTARKTKLITNKTSGINT